MILDNLPAVGVYCRRFVKEHWVLQHQVCDVKTFYLDHLFSVDCVYCSTLLSLISPLALTQEFFCRSWPEEVGLAAAGLAGTRCARDPRALLHFGQPGESSVLFCG